MTLKEKMECINTLLSMDGEPRKMSDALRRNGFPESDIERLRKQHLEAYVQALHANFDQYLADVAYDVLSSQE